MGKFLLFIIVFLSACNSDNVTKSGDIPVIEDSSKYPDSLILSEQDKVIGNIKFRMSKMKVKTLIEDFKNETKKPDKLLGKPYYDYFIGNYEYFQINDYYHNEELYKLEIRGDIILWEDYNSEITDKINSISEVLIDKFGQPETQYPIPEMSRMQKGYTYLIKAWEIGRKKIEVRIDDNGTSYFTSVLIYQPEIEYEIKNEAVAKKDSISKAVKDVF